MLLIALLNLLSRHYVKRVASTSSKDSNERAANGYAENFIWKGLSDPNLKQLSGRELQLCGIEPALYDYCIRIDRSFPAEQDAYVARRASRIN